VIREVVGAGPAIERRSVIRPGGASSASTGIFIS
jgi:hypothetical protein